MNKQKTITHNEAPTGIKGFIQVKRLIPGTAAKARTMAAAIKQLMRESAKMEIDGFLQEARLIKEQTEIKMFDFMRFLQDQTIEVASENHNLVMSSTDRGANLILRSLGNQVGPLTTYTLAITHGELGTGVVAPAGSDTALGTAVDRQSLTLSSMTSLTSLKLQFFWADAELANGTYTEIGTFSNGTASLGTGRLFNRALLLPTYTKATSEDTTMEINLTLTPI